MGSKGQKTTWKFPIFSRHHNTPTSTKEKDSFPSLSSREPEKPPKDFLCPISGHLMADPVILPTGQTFERGCIQACLHLHIDPPTGATPPNDQRQHSSGDSCVSPSTPLVPNLALKSTIFIWCDSHGIDRPRPMSKDAAVELVRSLISSSASPSPSSSLNNIKAAGAEGDGVGVDVDEKGKGEGEGDAFATSTDDFNTSRQSHLKSKSSTMPSRYSSSASSSSTSYASSSEEFLQNSTTNSALEEQILMKLRSSSEVEDQEKGLLLLRQMSRDSKEQRVLLCTPKLLSSLRPFLLSRLPNLQSHAAAAIVNLSLDLANKTPIIRSGAVPPLVSALKAPNPETRSHAVAAMFSLSVDETSKAAMGALGALPPLLDILSKPNEEVVIRRDAGLALYHLTKSCSSNRSKLAKLGAARVLLGVVSEQELGQLGGVLLMIMANLAGGAEGRAALMDAGVVDVVVDMIRKISIIRGDAAASSTDNQRREQCVGVLYGLSNGSLRFRGLARAAGAEEVLKDLLENGLLLDGNGGGGGGTARREMVRRILREINGEEHHHFHLVGIAASVHQHDDYDDDDDDEMRSVVSEPAVESRSRHHYGRSLPIDGVNSSEF